MSEKHCAYCGEAVLTAKFLNTVRVRLEGGEKFFCDEHCLREFMEGGPLTDEPVPDQPFKGFILTRFTQAPDFFMDIEKRKTLIGCYLGYDNILPSETIKWRRYATLLERENDG